MSKKLSTLISNDLSAKQEVEDFIKSTTEKVVFEKSVPTAANETLVKMQVTTNSYIGAIVHEYSHIITQNGLIRHIGSGSPNSRNILEWNSLFPNLKSFIVANDVFGGLFAINYGDLEGEYGEINYFSPLELTWYSLSCSHSEFVSWSFLGEIKDFYEHFYIERYSEDISKTKESNGLLIIPYLWSKEFQLIKGSAKEIPINELVSLNFEFQKKFRELVQ